MKKKLFHTVSAALLLAATGIAFAEVDCVPTATVAQTQFIKAFGVSNSAGVTSWNLVSDHISYGNQEWSILFVTLLDEAIKNPDEALIAGQTAFQNTTLLEPVGGQDEKYSVCIYSSSPKYLVVASSPPFDELFTAKMSAKFAS